MKFFATLVATCSLSFLLFAGAGCVAGPSQGCRFDPNACGGDVGATCQSDADCYSGACCTDGANCGGGMCTIPCSGDTDCPSFMACEHNICFFFCVDDNDCAVGQTCEHGRVCEWP